MTEIRAGSVLDSGRYRLERPLGAGGMATVWRAEDTKLGRTVAVKVISDTLALDPAYCSRFQREARIAARLSHPSLVKVFDYAAEGDRPFLVMECISGGTLADKLEQDAVLDLEPLARDLLSALAHIHDAGIVHRDVKPANVLIDGDNHARLTDFGIAHAPEATRLTSTGFVLGTLRYLAPEVSAGDPPSPQSDLYSCGVLLTEAGGSLPSGVEALVERLTRRRPQERPASAHEALRILDHALTTRAVAADTTELLGAAGDAGSQQPVADTYGQPAPPVRELHVTPQALALGVAAVALVVIVLAVVTGGDDRSSGAAPGKPAPANAPLTEQLDRLAEQVRLLPSD